MTEHSENPTGEAIAAEDDTAPGDSRPGSVPWPWLALLLTVIFPGAGHVYAGRLGQGWALWLGGLGLVWGAPLLGVFSTFAGLVLWLAAVLAYWVFAMVSAVRAARAARGATPGQRRWLAFAALLTCQLLLAALPPVRSWLPVRSFRIPSGGMEPTIQVGDRLMADMRAWSRREPRRGELVIHSAPDRPQTFFLKRVVALPGERIEIRDKQVYINGGPIEEPGAMHSDSRTYPASRFLPPQVARRDQYGPETVPEETLFLLGDNRDNSVDSRFYGPVDRSLVVGRPLYVYWSADRARIGRSLVQSEP